VFESLLLRQKKGTAASRALFLVERAGGQNRAREGGCGKMPKTLRGGILRGCEMVFCHTRKHLATKAARLC